MPTEVVLLSQKRSQAALASDPFNYALVFLNGTHVFLVTVARTHSH